MEFNFLALFLFSREARAAAQRAVEALEGRLASAMGPVIKEALSTSQLQLSAQWQIREEALKAELKTTQEKTLKRVANMVSQGTEVMVDDAHDQMEVASGDSADDDEDLDLRKKKKQRISPSENQKRLWLEARHMSEDFNKGDWKSVSVKRLLKEYTDHPAAKPFKFHDSDGEVALKYDSQKTAEKIFKELEGMFGSVGAAGTLLAEQIDVVNTAAKRAAKAFAAPQTDENDAVGEALQFCEDVKVLFIIFLHMVY